MKFQKLDLIAFGPFTGQSINFAANTANLHLIFGPNEAGKSSSLRAIRNFLFGFPSRTTDDQLHAATDQRIGATLVDAQANEWSAIRRRGRKTTLRTGDDKTPADEAQLARMLGSIDREQFCARFGLHYEEMVEGGTAMAKGEGELGQRDPPRRSDRSSLAANRHSLAESLGRVARNSGIRQCSG